MQEKSMRYGQFLRFKRISDDRSLTIKDIAEELGVSLSFVSDVEAGRRKPYDEEKTEKLIEFLQLTKEDIARMQDLAAKETAEIPKDLEETIMQTRAGDVIRAAVRMTRKGIADEDDWRRFVYYLKAKEAEINA